MIKNIYIKTEPAGEICAGKSLLIPYTLRVKPTPIVNKPIDVIY
jgi:hypothetical protein